LTDDLIPLPQLQTQNKDVELWLIEALILSEESQSLPLDLLSRFPTAFPFSMKLEQSDIMNSGRFNFQQLSGNRSEIVLKTSK